ncbi:MAG: hypothetical protein UW86_C0019G0009 [Microgenomates group bacterium GW2011_GWA1_Microgenomates_45_10]|uniref:DUF5667 domain-containing protein n=1 Tax=Candidatus Yanofskybacteria bacterium RIFCSPHIGHO2_01_FULL_48_25b TaxID=1802672 RepID=A0A1F8F1C2_9BACT|nr:MAG: hypothetical protein UW86_C0019G0009 [Microgenomates group bacterium GW2011_GWA1_Microgenomates_45_10]OGN06937.1 MAG: hypothetical protein A2669_01720 [Candidatus Yanofskybacteria bacterium RIFCSPHIGHO2_01_FULL_48_25b]
MIKSIKQLISEARNLKLSEGEKIQLRAYVINEIAHRQHLRRSILGTITTNFKFKPMPILLAILIALGGGVSFAAEQTLPGDTLYPVKLNVNEKIRTLTALDAETRAHWEAKMAERRLDEAEELAAEGKLNAEARAQIEANFKAHADRVQARIKEFEDKDSDVAAEVASNFETSLKAHERILLDIGASRDKDTESEVKILGNRIKSESEDTVEARARVEAKLSASVNSETAAQGRLNSAENKISEVRAFIEQNKDRFEAEVVAKAKARLDAAADLIVQGKAKIEAKAYAEAFMIFSRAHAIAQDAKLMLMAKDRFENQIEQKTEMNVRSGASVDSNTETETKTDGASTESSGRIKINFGF